MSCQQSQQQCPPPPKCPSPKCPPKSPAQCLPPASSGCGHSTEGGCCLSPHRPRRAHRCRHQSSEGCSSGRGESGGPGCGHSSGGCC